ncbi:MAG: hypothetical protein ACXAEL_11790 [Candidatus Hodarchaeales archaeon]
MEQRSKLEIKVPHSSHEELLSRFASNQYQDPVFSPQRPDRWYNGSLMGVNGKSSELFGPKGRLRSLHSKITSQETPGSQPRSQLYRQIGDLLSCFFPITILDPLIEDITTLENVRLPQALDEAVHVVLAAMEMYLRKYNRMILKDKIIQEIGEELGVDIHRKKLIGAKWFLAKGGFWKEHLREIGTATYAILRSLIQEIITSHSFPAPDSAISFRRQLYRRSMILVGYLEEACKRPQALEIYAHAIVSLAAETLLRKAYLAPQRAENEQFKARGYRAKRQLREILPTKFETAISNQISN